jgi:hypothetical protein
MQPDPAAAPPNSPGAVAAIANMTDPVLRNCCITEGYYQLASAFAWRFPGWTNWLMFAVWASKQAGRTIRGEDLTAELHRRLRIGSRWLAPVESVWRVLLRRGLLNPSTRLGRLVRAIPGPLDAIERASDALAKGNQLIFGEIGVEFARYLAARDMDEFFAGFRDGDRPYLRRAFEHYELAAREPDAHRRAELQYLGNVEIAWHEQVRAQPLVTEALEGPVIAAQELGARVLLVIAPAGLRFGLITWVVGAGLKPLSKFGVVLGRQVITEALMTMALPGGRVLELGRNIESMCPDCLLELENPELRELLGLFDGDAVNCGARDWTDLLQRMRYIARLFRVFHLDATLGEAPFRVEQVAVMRGGRLPGGEL